MPDSQHKWLQRELDLPKDHKHMLEVLQRRALGLTASQIQEWLDSSSQRPHEYSTKRRWYPTPGRPRWMTPWHLQQRYWLRKTRERKQFIERYLNSQVDDPRMADPIPYFPPQGEVVQYIPDMWGNFDDLNWTLSKFELPPRGRYGNHPSCRERRAGPEDADREEESTNVDQPRRSGRSER